MDSIKLSINAYIQARKWLIAGYDNYIALCAKEGPQTVILSEDVEPFAALNETIFWGISLYERKNKVADDFMSGIKFIFNTMKHCDTSFQVYSICHPGIKISIKVHEGPDGPAFTDASIKPDLIFGEIEDIPIYKKNKNQRDKYIQLIQGKSIPDIMTKLDEVLMRLFPSELWNEL